MKMTKTELKKYQYLIGALDALQNQALPKQLTSSDKMLLLVLSSHAGEGEGYCSPSVSTLAKECGLSRGSIQRSLKNLKVHGLLDIQPRNTETSNGQYIMLTNSYFIKGIPKFAPIETEDFDKAFDEGSDLIDEAVQWDKGFRPDIEDKEEPDSD